MSGETEISGAIRDALESIGCVVVRVNSGTAPGHGGGFMRLAKEGTPDIWAARRGFQGWLETKTPVG
jgi:hypothetical protein